MIGKKEDISARTKRGNLAWAKVQNWLWKSSLRKRTRALIVQAVVDSTMLFDSSARAWAASEVAKFQSVPDRAYRFIWNDGRGLPLIRMQRESINMFRIRNGLQISSVRTKVEIRALERAAHVMRMPNSRLSKQVVFGRWDCETPPSRKLRGGIVAYWRRLLREAGWDWTDAENLVSNRKRWRQAVRPQKPVVVLGKGKWATTVGRNRYHQGR